MTYLVGEAGIHQFFDIGTGLPSAGNVHEIAQAIEPTSRIVYVDNDPVVLVHARALLNSEPEGRTAYIEADLRDPDKILANPVLTGTLDMSRPVALMLVATMHFVTDDHDPYGIVRRLLSVLPSGSYLVMTNATGDYLTPEEYAHNVEVNERSGVPFGSAAGTSSPASSTAWNCSRRASARSSSGAPTSRRRNAPRSRRSPCTAPSPASTTRLMV